MKGCLPNASGNEALGHTIYRKHAFITVEKRGLNSFNITGIPNGFPYRIRWSTHEGWCKACEKHLKNNLQAAWQVFYRFLKNIWSCNYNNKLYRKIYLTYIQIILFNNVNDLRLQTYRIVFKKYNFNRIYVTEITDSSTI